MNTSKNTLKNIMHLLCCLLTTLIILLSSTNLILPYFFYLEPEAIPLLVVSSASSLYFSVIFLFIGAFISDDKGIFLSRKFLFFLSLVELILGFLLGKPKAIKLHRSKKHVTKEWNASGILIIGIILICINIITMMPVTDSETILSALTTGDFIETPYGLILAALCVSWFLFIIFSQIWRSIDRKEKELLKNEKSTEQEKDTLADIPEKNVLLKCVNCAKLYNYDRFDGICPACGKYNTPSVALYLENGVQKKKIALHLYKIVIVFILVVPIIIIALHLNSFVKWLGTLEENSVETSIEPPLSTFHIDDYNSESFTSEEVDQLLMSIEEDTGSKILYHKEFYTNNEVDGNGDLVDKITIIVTTEGNNSLQYFQYYKYQTTTEKHNEGDILPVETTSQDISDY